MTDAIDDVRAFPINRLLPWLPPPEYAEMRAEAPLTRVRLFDGRLAWVVTGYETARTLLIDQRLSSDHARQGFPALSPGNVPVTTIRTLVRLDPPDHTALRRSVMGQFTVRRINELRPRLRDTAEELIDDMLASGQPVDLKRAYAFPMAARTICHLLGVPYEDREFFEERIYRMALEAEPELIVATVFEIVDYLDKLVARKETDPGEDLISRLAHEQVATGELERSDLVGLAMLLLIAGHVTSAMMITMGTFTLLEHPEQLAKVRADPALIPSAVEELLRYLSIADLVIPRVALEDIEVAGQVIKAGDGVIVLSAAANHDESAFPAPATFDIDRATRRHVAFGYGVHQCLGQNLARVELEVAFEVLLRRVPTLRMAAETADIVPPDQPMPDLLRLPVAW